MSHRAVIPERELACEVGALGVRPRRDSPETLDDARTVDYSQAPGSRRSDLRSHYEQQRD